MKKFLQSVRVLGVTFLAFAVFSIEVPQAAFAASTTTLAQQLNSLMAASKPLTWGTVITKTCRANNWTRSKTFVACKNYAKKQGLLKTPLKTVLFPGTKIKRSQLDIFLTRIGTPAGAGASAVSPSAPVGPAPVSSSAVIPARRLPAQSAPLVSETFIPTDFFAKMRLSEAMPRRFYMGEVYVLEGDLVGSNESEAFAFLCPEGAGCNNSTNFVGTATSGHFKIPLRFDQAGNFQIGVVPGRSGESNIETISVMPIEPEVSASTGVIRDLSASYNKGDTTFQWSGSGAWTRLVIFQDDQRQDFIFRKGATSYSPDSVYFKNFKKGAAYWFVESGSQRSEAQRVSLVLKPFRKLDKDQLSITTLAEKIGNVGVLRFSGRAIKTISKRAAITKPDGTVHEIFFSTDDISPGTNFTVDVELLDFGTYIFEINNPEGSAALNIPIFVGNELPLLPDYFALNPAKLSTAPLGDLDTARQRLLALINADRKSQGLSPVTLSTPITSVAQAHTHNMLALNFFGHRNPAGQMPDDRRRAAGISTAIRENLAKATSLELIEEGLMRSPVHREVIIDPDMQKVGIGIAKDNQGYFLVTQNFSGDVLNAADLNSFGEKLLSSTNMVREKKNLSLLRSNEDLRAAAAEWSRRMAEQSFFGMTDKNGVQLLNFIRSQGINASIQINILKASDKSILAEELVAQDGAISSGNRNIGIGLSVDGMGDIYMTTLYTQ